MTALQDELERAMEDAPRVAAVQILAKQCEETGVKLSAEQREELYEHVRVDDDAIYLTGPLILDGQRIELSLDEDDVAAIEACMGALGDKMPRLLKRIGDRLGEDLLHKLRDAWPEQSRMLDQDRHDFTRRLDERWGKPLSMLRMMLAVSREFGEMTSSAIAVQGEGEALRRNVLTRLHARSCQVCDEIACLLTNGFADGAMARWRTLHEISVVALFILERGEATAQRYLDHRHIETYQAARSYREYSNRLGYVPMADEDFEAAKRARDKAAANYERSFTTRYGWAAAALDMKKPNLLNIEKSVGVDHLRPYYKLACLNVHAGSKGSVDRLGLLSGSDTLLAGTSNAGLSNPGQNAAISLYRSSVALGLLVPTLDSLVGLHVLSELANDICQAFHAASEQLKEDAASGTAEE